LQGHEAEGLHDHDDRGCDDAAEAESYVDSKELRPLLALLTVLFENIETPDNIAVSIMSQVK
jgi:hypothetical protein